MFEYQPGLPIPNGKTCLWLFLSTEIMFFAGLIGTYIVLRFGAVAWPAPHDVHLSEPIGAFNTFVLICSSVTVVLAPGSGQAQQTAKAKGFILLTFLLGSVFLGVKVYEYQQKFAHGIYPQKPHGLVYDKADIYYAAAVRKRLNDAADRDHDSSKPPTPEDERKLRWSTRSVASWSTPAELAVRNEPDSPEGRIKLMELAFAIYPPHDHGQRWRTRRAAGAVPRNRPRCSFAAFQRHGASGAGERHAAERGHAQGLQRPVSLAAAADHDSRRPAVGQHLFPAHRLPRPPRAGGADRVLP